MIMNDLTFASGGDDGGGGGGVGARPLVVVPHATIKAFSASRFVSKRTAKHQCVYVTKYRHSWVLHSHSRPLLFKTLLCYYAVK